ncbi:hypothetical protein Tco_0786210, partial [Tanacetum coccineum]
YSLTGKSSVADRVREPIVQLLWGLVNSENIDYADLICETLVIHKISEEELVEKLKFVAKGEPKCNPTYRMPIPEAMLINAPKKKKDEVPRRSRTITIADNLLEDPDQAKGAKESKKERILEEIRKALGEGSIAVPDSLNHNDSSQSSIWESSDDDKTEIDDDSNKGDNDDEFDKDSDAGDDHTTSFGILTVTVVPLLDTILEVQEEAPIDQAIDYPPATTTITPPTKSKKKRAKTLLKRVIRQKNDSKKSIMQKIGEHEQKLNALAQINHAEAIKDSVQANVINKVKNQLPKYVPKAVFDYVQPRLERTVLDVIKKNLINMFKSSSTPANNLTEYELKHKLYDMMRSGDRGSS